MRERKPDDSKYEREREKSVRIREITYAEENMRGGERHRKTENEG